ncbi:hypothetical protein VE01_06038 [Pseudogymnoascus verrucosus]|uniref:Uncharacterized protein n=1 Tax=Pseudogymnoascus verrucosus TaxID=342668 RepID=A0A1B8GJ67_9PEZI|nr:uncharacterized protein VE01_06038 [Pseudogymnoascus verrucosus]OBT95865.1 hypothetical protein VE01_06038 [Pseudogymnoascus verrucosus]
MKFKPMDSTPSEALLTNSLALFSFLASVLASPILIPDAPNSLSSKSSCVLGKCGLSGQCFKAGSCFGINIFDPDWSHCSICSCPGQGFNGRTDPTCVMDTGCLTVQLGTKPDPCAHKRHQYEGREASANPAPQRDGGVIDKYPTNPNIEAPTNIPESTPFTSYLARRSTIEADALEKNEQLKPESHVLHERDEFMKEYARLIDDGPGGPVTPDAAMMERLRSITHPGKRACYTVENGAIVSSACGTVDNNGDIDAGVDADVNVDVKKRGGCFTVENGVIVEKRGGCGSVEPDVEGDPRDPLTAVAEGDPRDPLVAVAEGDPRDPLAAVEKRGGCFTIENGVIIEKRGGCGFVKPVVEGDPRDPLTPVAEGDPRDPLAAVEKRVGCFVKENGIVYAQPNCDDPNRGVGPPFPLAEGDPRDPLTDVAEGDPRDPLAAVEKRGGCFTVENGVIVEKRGGCGSVEPDVEGDPRDE